MSQEINQEENTILSFNGENDVNEYDSDAELDDIQREMMTYFENDDEEESVSSFESETESQGTQESNERPNMDRGIGRGRGRGRGRSRGRGRGRSRGLRGGYNDLTPRENVEITKSPSLGERNARNLDKEIDVDENAIPGEGKNRAKWLNKGQEFDHDLQDNLFSSDSGPTVLEGAIKDPIDAFDLFFPEDELIKNIFVRETNRRAYQELADEKNMELLGDWKVLTVKEMKVWLASIITMSMIKMPSERDYFSLSPIFSCNLIRNMMRRKRWEQIKHCFSVASPTPDENSNDRLAKVRPFLKLVLEIIQKNWTLGRDAALDESQCKCGHRNARCSYRGETKNPCQIMFVL